MKKIIQKLEAEIPHGNWCNQGGRESWCKYYVPPLNYNRSYCKLLEEYVDRKECGINEADIENFKKFDNDYKENENH